MLTKLLERRIERCLILFIIGLFNIIFIDKDNVSSNDGLIIE
jgi:hypothetical protein